MAVAAGGNANRITTNNYVALESGAYNGTIVDEWPHYVTKEESGKTKDGRPIIRSKYSRTPTDDQEIKISVTLDEDPSITLEKRMAFYVTAKSSYGKMVASLTGFAIDSDEIRQFDSKALVGMKVVADIQLAGTEEKPYARVKEIRARPKTLRPGVRPNGAATIAPADAAGKDPSDAAATDRQRAQIKTNVLARGFTMDSPRLRKLVGEATEFRTTDVALITGEEAVELLCLIEAIPLPTPEEADAIARRISAANLTSTAPATSTSGTFLPDSVVMNVTKAIERAGISEERMAELIAAASLETAGEVTYEIRRLSIAGVNALLASVKAAQHA